MTDTSKYNIGYVDENDQDIFLFKQHFAGYFNISSLKPEPSTKLDDVISWVIDSQLDLIVVDYDLKGKLGVVFFGNEILESLKQGYLNFPMFMLTNYEEKAINNSDASIDDIIYDKHEVYKNKKELFITRIKNKIAKYKSDINQAQERHKELTQKPKLTLGEEEEFLNLDEFIERVYGKKGATPKFLKNTQTLEKLNELVDKADKILEKFDKNE